jgi:hypothetical protein
MAAAGGVLHSGCLAITALPVMVLASVMVYNGVNMSRESVYCDTENEVLLQSEKTSILSEDAKYTLIVAGVGGVISGILLGYAVGAQRVAHALGFTGYGELVVLAPLSPIITASYPVTVFGLIRMLFLSSYYYLGYRFGTWLGWGPRRMKRLKSRRLQRIEKKRSRLVE